MHGFKEQRNRGGLLKSFPRSNIILARAFIIDAWLKGTAEDFEEASTMHRQVVASFPGNNGTNVRLVPELLPPLPSALSRLIKLAIQFDAFRHPLHQLFIIVLRFPSRDEWGFLFSRHTQREEAGAYTRVYAHKGHETRVTCKFAFTWKRRREIIAKKIRRLRRKIDRYLSAGSNVIRLERETIKNRVFETLNDG